MAYRFSLSDRSLETAARRIALEQIEGAIRDVAALEGPPFAVHPIRKRMKKLRGLVRLIRPRFDGFAVENAAFRDAGKMIAGLRDAEITGRWLAVLAADIGENAEMAGLRERQAEAAASATHPPELERFAEAMRTARRRARKWKLRGKGFDGLGKGLGATWRAARRGQDAAAAAARRDLAAEPFHEWRKPVKYHWYHARLMAPIWPEMMEPHVAAVDTLGELLGDHNDLDIVAQWLSGEPLSRELAADLAAAALTRRRALARQALDLGARLFADSDRALTRRWGAWWDSWREENARRTPET